EWAGFDLKIRLPHRARAGQEVPAANDRRPQVGARLPKAEVRMAGPLVSLRLVGVAYCRSVTRIVGSASLSTWRIEFRDSPQVRQLVTGASCRHVDQRLVTQLGIETLGLVELGQAGL